MTSSVDPGQTEPKEPSDMGIRCLPGPTVCPKTEDQYGTLTVRVKTAS